VARRGEVLESMVGIRKRISGNGGVTRIGPLPIWPFSERAEGGVRSACLS